MPLALESTRGKLTFLSILWGSSHHSENRALAFLPALRSHSSGSGMLDYVTALFIAYRFTSFSLYCVGLFIYYYYYYYIYFFKSKEERATKRHRGLRAWSSVTLNVSRDMVFTTRKGHLHDICSKVQKSNHTKNSTDNPTISYLGHHIHI